MKNNNIIYIALFLVCGLVWSQPVWAKINPTQPSTSGNGDPNLPYIQAMAIPNPPCNSGTSRAELDINNVRTLLLNDGGMFWDGRVARYEVPKTVDLSQPKRHSLYSGGIWIGGKERGTTNLYILAQTFNVNRTYFPGPLDSARGGLPATSQARCLKWNRHFKVNRTAIIKFISDYQQGLISTLEDIPNEILTWPGRNNPYIGSLSGLENIEVNFSLARFFDRDRDGIYDPLNDGDYPLPPGGETGLRNAADQTIFWVTNDAGNLKDFRGGQRSPSIGMEIHTEAFAYATNDPINDMSFYRQKLINKGTVILDSCYMGQWTDPDLGNAGDDYVGCDVPRGLAICYNGDDDDEGVQGYGLNPPAVAIDFFRGPFADPNDGVDNDKDFVIDEQGERIIMSNFVYYNNSTNPRNGDPSTPTQYYNFLRNMWKDGSFITYDLAAGLTARGAPVPGPGGSFPAPRANFMFPGTSDQADNSAGVCWSSVINRDQPGVLCPLPLWTERQAQNPPGDRRFLASAGPFQLRPGAVNELTIGVVWARASSGGATGSFNQLLAGDDIAQKLFDNNFSLLSGPNSPDLEITELDQELIIAIQPDDYSIEFAPFRMTSENYTERDSSLSLLGGDTIYKFQGYIIYQLADDKVTPQELNNPDRARVLLQCDLKDGISTIVNEEFNVTTGTYTPIIKVQGEDKGLVSTIRVRRDLFNIQKEGMTNFKKYYYRAIAYGYNRNRENKTPYLQGKDNGKVYISIPHKPDPEKSGTTIQSTYGQGLPITRIHGSGNGGLELNISQAQIDEIVKNNSVSRLTYETGQGPINVKVYDPKRVKPGVFSLKLTSRLRYDTTRASYIFKVGDTIVSSPVRLQAGERLNRSIRQTAGQAIILAKRKVSNEAGFMDLELDVLNDEQGGTFQYITDTIELPSKFLDYEYNPQTFRRIRRVNDSARASDFVLFDYWILTQGTQTIHSTRTLTEAYEQLVPEYGISLRISRSLSSGQLVFENLSNGYQNAEIISEQPANAGLELIRADGAGNFKFSRIGGAIDEADPNAVFSKILDGSFMPYIVSSTWSRVVGLGGGAYIGSSALPIDTFLNKLRNIDIVITSDKNLWSRVPVFQGDTTVPHLQGLKSRLSSLNKDFQPEGSLSPYTGPLSPNPTLLPSRNSRGMSWFPGYAIDVDRGIRLNMGFGESKSSGPNGANLIWDPTNANDAGKNFIYVFSTIYDESRAYEHAYDSTFGNRPLAPPAIETAMRRTFNNMMWIGLLKRVGRRDLLGSKVTVKLRVNRAYESYPTGASTFPKYEFSTLGLEAKRNEIDVAKNALDLIRVVPNPYYGYSAYETSQVDNRIKITNIPTKCVISIFNLGGSLVRRFQVDVSGQTGTNTTTFQEWDLKNQQGIPIAGGVYIVHVAAVGLGEKVIKWFGVPRPIDLDSF